METGYSVFHFGTSKVDFHLLLHNMDYDPLCDVPICFIRDVLPVVKEQGFSGCEERSFDCNFYSSCVLLLEWEVVTSIAKFKN